MKTLLILALVTLAFSDAQAVTKSVRPGKHLGTKFNFEDLLINGKYQYPDEAVATVEDEKSLDDLLGPRKQFKDRMQQAAGMQ